MRSVLAFLVMWALLIFAHPLHAQSFADDVVVNGQRLPRAVAEARARAYVRQLGVALGMEQAARWIDPVCPKATGLDPALITWVETRVRQVAGEIGASLGKPGCAPNFFILFVSDGAGTTRALLDHAPDLVANFPRERREALLSGAAPIRWWQQIAPRSRDGAPIIDGFNRLGGGGSVITTATIAAIDRATVVIDAERATGAMLSAVADYAALVGLAGLTPQTPPPADSILALFEGDRRARELSLWDRNFLQALYRVPPARDARRHRALLAGRLAEAVRE